MKTKWSKLCHYLRTKELGTVFTTKQLRVAAKIFGIESSSLYGYLSLLSNAQFFRKLGKAQYELVNVIPDHLTMWDCNTLLKGDNLTYIENLKNRQDKAVIRAIYVEERNNVLSKLLTRAHDFVSSLNSEELALYGISSSDLKMQVQRWQNELGRELNPTAKWKKVKQNVAFSAVSKEGN